MNVDKLYLQRCYDLALQADLAVGTNPKVGALIVYKNRIIGEGYFSEFGKSHAEIKALQSVKEDDLKYLPESTIYVSLEPCCIYNKTPPCSKAIISAGIKNVHIGTLDPFPGIQGESVKQLRAAGINVTLHNDTKADEIIRPFSTFHLKKRPYVTLKWAQTRDNYIGSEKEQYWISHPYTDLFSHRLRAHSGAILVGTNTAVIDNPTLTTRYITGPNPLRMVIDLDNKIPESHIILSDDLPTVIFSKSHRNLNEQKTSVIVDRKEEVVKSILDYCFTHQISHLMVEGGARLLKAFIKATIWDEAMIIKSNDDKKEGVKAPLLSGKLHSKQTSGSDTIYFITNPEQEFNLT